MPPPNLLKNKSKEQLIKNVVICLNVYDKYKFIKCDVIAYKFSDQYNIELNLQKSKINTGLYNFLSKHYKKVNLMICDSNKIKLLAFTKGDIRSTTYTTDNGLTYRLTFDNIELLSTDFSKYILSESYKWYKKSKEESEYILPDGFDASIPVDKLLNSL